MNHFETHIEVDSHKKWSDWSPRPQREPRKLTHYASGLVLLASTVVASGIPQQLFS